MGESGLLKRLGRMLTEDLDEIEDHRIERECSEAGARRAKDCCRGDEVDIVGELRSVETGSRACKTGVTAEIFDGTDTVFLKWMGRNRIPGIEPGRRLTVHGRLAEVDGRKVIFNPYYDLHAAER